MFADGYLIGCHLEKCIWWAVDECAVTKISWHIEFAQINGEEDVEVTCATE